jgi:hypothetical protein
MFILESVVGIMLMFLGVIVYSMLVIGIKCGKMEEEILLED